MFKNKQRPNKMQLIIQQKLRQRINTQSASVINKGAATKTSSANAVKRHYKAAHMPYTQTPVNTQSQTRLITIDNYFDKIFILNMKRRIDRWYNMVRRMEELGFTNYERFVAVDGYSSPYKEQWEAYAQKPWNQFDKKYKRKAIRSPGVWGILNSMRKMMMTAKERGYKRLLVLQDDAMFHHNFKALFNDKVRKIPQNWKVLFLGVTQYSFTKEMLESKIYYHPAGMADGAFAMAFDSSVYDFFINEIGKFVLPFDSGPSMAAQRRFLRETIVMHPFLIIADTTESDCRGERKTEEFSKAVKWDYPKFEEYKQLSANPLISVIIVTRNSEEYVADAIESILAQTHSNIEIIVFDDASSDGSVNKIKELQHSSNGKIRLYVSDVNMPDSVYYNMGILVAKGEAFSFHSPKYCSYESRYAEQLEALRKCEGIATISDHTGEIAYCTPLVTKKVQMEIGYLETMNEGAEYEYIRKIQSLNYKSRHVENMLYYPNATLEEQLASGEKSFMDTGERTRIDEYINWFSQQTTGTYRAFPPKVQKDGSGSGFIVDVEKILEILDQQNKVA